MDFNLRESANMREKIINIEIIRHRGTGMYLAMSDDMKGLYVHARTLAELGERVPVAIKDIYAAAGRPVESVTPIDHDIVEESGFEPSRCRYQAREAA